MFAKRFRDWLKQSHAHSLLFLCLLLLVFGVLSPRFFTVSNAQNIINAVAVIGMLSIGTTFVIANGGIDLSSGSVLALTSTASALIATRWSLPPVAVLLAASGIGIACGLLTAFFINLTGAPSFIVTLGMLSTVRAVAYILSDASPIYGLEDDVVNLGQGHLFGLSAPLWFLFSGAFVAWIILRHTRFGAHVLVAGDSPIAAEALGIELWKLRLKIYGFAGLFSGLGGFLFLSRTNSGDPASGQSYELMAITAVVLGGANLFGGRASIVGTLSGVFCLGVLQNGLNLLAVGTYFQVLFIGLVLLGSAFLAKLGELR